MNFITLGKKWADGSWVLLKGPPYGLQAQRAYVDGIGVSDPTYSEARIIELGIGVKRIFYTPDEIVKITAADKTIAYGSNKPSSFAVTWSKNISNTYYTGTLSTACAYTKGNNAGTYPITPSGLTATDKYAIAFVAGTLTVSKVALTLTVANAQMEVGGTAPEFSFTGTGFVNGENATALTGSEVYTVKDELGNTVADPSAAAPGEYEVHLSGVTAANYELTMVAGTLTVSKAELTLTVTDAEMVYGASAPAFAFTGAGYIAGEDATDLTGSEVYTVKDELGNTVADPSAAAPGEYEVHLSGVTAANYELTMVAGTLTVSKAELTLTVANAQMVEGGSAPEFSFSGTGFVNDENATALGGSAVYTVKDELGNTVADPSAAAPGEYEVHLSGVTADNYELTMVAGTLTITE